jgi:8-oxo-dGTP pyrophosphatase MutT (NUDIX family)
MLPLHLIVARTVIDYRVSTQHFEAFLSTKWCCWHGIRILNVVMAHIHTGVGDHDLTASAFIIRTDFDEPKIMLHMHRKLHRYMQFGGHVELHENPWQAVKHEVQEESGYEISQLKLLQPIERIKSLKAAALHPQPICINTHVFNNKLEFKDNSHFHMDIEYAFVTDQEPRHPIGEGESQELALFSREQLLALSTDSIDEDTRTIILFIFDTCLLGWEQVPVK